MIRQLVLAAGTIAMATTLAAPAYAADDHRAVKLEQEAVALIEDIEEVGRDVQYHAERLQLFLTSGADVSRWTHYHHLDEIKLLVNDHLRPALVRLDEIETALPAWKQEGIARMIAAAQELARDASSAFVVKRTSAATMPVLNPDYRALVLDLGNHARTLVTTADVAHEYAVAHLKATEAGLLVRR